MDTFLKISSVTVVSISFRCHEKVQRLLFTKLVFNWLQTFPEVSVNSFTSSEPFHLLSQFCVNLGKEFCNPTQQETPCKSASHRVKSTNHRAKAGNVDFRILSTVANFPYLPFLQNSQGQENPVFTLIAKNLAILLAYFPLSFRVQTTLLVSYSASNSSALPSQMAFFHSCTIANANVYVLPQSHHNSA